VTTGTLTITSRLFAEQNNRRLYKLRRHQTATQRGDAEVNPKALTVTTKQYDGYKWRGLNTNLFRQHGEYSITGFVNAGIASAGLR